MLRLSFFLLLALAACALAARIPRDAEAKEAAASEAATTAAAPPLKVAAPAKPAAKSASPATAIYTSKFDNVNLDQILRSDRLLNNYLKCLMDRGPCTPDAAELKRLLPDALESDCSRCTSKQREGSEKVIEHMIKNKPKQWTELQAKYDPNGNYKSKYQHLAQERGIKI